MARSHSQICVLEQLSGRYNPSGRTVVNFSLQFLHHAVKVPLILCSPVLRGNKAREKILFYNSITDKCLPGDLNTFSLYNKISKEFDVEIVVLFAFL